MGNAQNTETEKDLLKASRNNDIDTIKTLVNENNVSTRDVSNGATLLHCASYRGYYDVCVLLLEKGAHVNMQSNRGVTALHEAACDGHVDICKLLLDRGAHVNMQCNIGMTALHDAAHEGHADTCKLLLDRGAHVNMQRNRGVTALHEAACDGHVDICKLLLDKGAQVNLSSIEGITPLINAAHGGHVNVCKLLLEKGADVNMQTEDGGSALMNATARGHPETCKVLLERGADINQQNIDGNTPLQVAIIYNQLATCKCLLEHHADVNIKNNKGKSAIDLANETKNEKIITLINEYTNNVDKKIEETRKQLKLLEIERIIKIKKEKLKKIEEYNQLNRQSNEKEKRNQEIQKSIDLLLSLMEQNNNFLQTESSERDLSNVLLGTNILYQKEVNSLLEQQATNGQILSSNKDKMKLNDVKQENYDHLKQEVEHMENRFKEGKYDEIIHDVDKDCPICFEDMRPPIYQCPEGHVLCDECFHQICATTKKCPFCRELLSLNNRIRNRALEEIIMNDTKREAKI